MKGRTRILSILFMAVMYSFESPYTSAQTVQKAGLQLPSDAAAARDDAKQFFTDAFNAYTQSAFGHDDLAPITKGFVDSRNGWGASIVDAMSTMKIMGLDDLFNQAVNFSSNIDFSQSKTGGTVSVFESTIRYVAGLLSAYELNENQPQALVDKAKELADKLVIGFDGSSPVPFGWIDFAAGQPVRNPSNIAEAGTLTLEYATLSKYTNDPKYRQLAEGSVKHIAQLPAPLPGLAAQGIDPSNGNFIGGLVTWSGGSDSYFEYLAKYPFFLNSTDSSVDPIYMNTWMTAVDSSMQWLIKESVVGGWTFMAEMSDDRKINHVGSHLACFHGGNWILGGKLSGNDTIVDLGLKLTDACWNTYASTNTGIGPEQFAFVSTPSNPPPNGQDDGSSAGGSQGVPADQTQFLNKNGFYIQNSAYILRPEVLESNFYAWRVTGDPKYFNNAQSALNSFKKWLVVPGGVSGIHDVMRTDFQDQDRIDDTESFFFAEVMKYLYLTFDDPNHISLDDWVFNTEAHPFKRGSVSAASVSNPSSDSQQSPSISNNNVPAPGQTDSQRTSDAIPRIVSGAPILMLLLWEIAYLYLA